MFLKPYTVRAYESRAQGEAGRTTPKETSGAHDWQTAQHYARQLASDYGAAVIVNNDTGARYWY
jgi:hypothetical protein